jgi:hypothetical protein
MSRKLDGDISEWARDIVDSSHMSGFSGINVVEKILRDPGFSTGGSRHRVHWWPRTRNIAKMSKAMHQIDKLSQICLIIDSGYVLTDDGLIFDKHKLAKSSSLTVRRFNECRKKGLLEVRVIHGKGTGALREGVHRLLATLPEVRHYRLGDESSGSWGATLVTLKPSD